MKKVYGLALVATLLYGVFIVLNVCAGPPADRPDPLRLYTSCQFDDGLEIVQLDRLPKDAEKFRTVKTAGGDRKVSVMDGYRVMLRYPKADYFFANLKAEQSAPQSYAKDKEAVIESLRYAAAADKMEVAGNAYNGFESYGLEDPVIDRGGTIAVQVLFSDERQQIITVYFLNQGRKNRRYQTIEEFHTLKENFLKRYTDCVRANLKS